MVASFPPLEALIVLSALRTLSAVLPTLDLTAPIDRLQHAHDRHRERLTP